MNLGDIPGNPTYGLKQEYEKLMLITNLNDLKNQTIDIVRPYLLNGMSQENYNKFIKITTDIQTLDEMRTYITNFIMKGMFGIHRRKKKPILVKDDDQDDWPNGASRTPFY